MSNRDRQPRAGLPAPAASQPAAAHRLQQARSPLTQLNDANRNVRAAGGCSEAVRTHVWTRTERTRAPDARRAQPAARARGAPCMYVDSRSFNHSDFNLLLSPPHLRPLDYQSSAVPALPLRTHQQSTRQQKALKNKQHEHPGLRDAARCASGPRRYSTAAERPAVPSASLRIPEITHRNPRSWDAASGSRLRCTSLSTALLRAPGPRLSLSRPPHGAMRGPHPQSISHLHRHTASSSF